MKKRNRFVKMVLLGAQQLNDSYFQGMAAQISFYLLLSLVPMVILISQAIGFVLGSNANDNLGWLVEDADGAVAGLLKNLFTYKSGSVKNIIFLVVALWSASRAQFSMMRINNYINTEGKSTGTGYIHERIRAIFNSFLTIIAIVLALVFMSYGGDAADRLFGNSQLWSYLRWPLALVLFFVVVSIYYFTLPEKRVRIAEIIPGSIFAALGILLVTFVYSMYTSTVANYDVLYGSLATIVALMFWFFFLSWVFCLGMMFNKVWRDTDE